MQNVPPHYVLTKIISICKEVILMHSLNWDAACIPKAFISNANDMKI